MASAQSRTDLVLPADNPGCAGQLTSTCFLACLFLRHLHIAVPPALPCLAPSAALAPLLLLLYAAPATTLTPTCFLLPGFIQTCV